MTTRDRSELTQSGLNLIQQALSIYDQDLRLAVCNRRFGEMFDLPTALTRPGASFAETIRHLVERGEYGPVDDPDAFVAARVRQARAFEPHYLERTRPSGMVISVEGHPLRQGGWVAVYTDITAIKRQEALLRARSEELSEQVLAHAEALARTNRELAATIAALEETKRELTEMESRTRMTTEMMPAHIARLGPDFRYTYSNRQLGVVLPGRPAEVEGLHAREALGDEAFARIEPNLRRACSGEPSVLEFNHEGSGRRIRVAFTPDFGPEGRVNGVYVLSMDVTEEAQARAALAQTHKRELAARLTSGLAHDFSNLLTVIMGLQGKLEGMELPAEARELVGATLTAARRGGTLLDRLAAISGRRDMRPEPTDLGALLAGVETLATPSLPAGVRLTTRAQGLSGPLLLDRGALEDALINLVLNARDAIGPGPGEISIIARPHGDLWIGIEVADTGPGFTPEALENALNPFFTTKGGAGSGLGLSMVYDHAKLCGGQVRLANAPEGGARVFLRLPRRQAGASGPAMPEPGARLVLLIEDIDEIRTQVREMLLGLGHQVIEATGAEEARALAGIEGLGLVLSDINLGDGDGPELATEIAGARGIPAALMTSLPATDPRRIAHGLPVIEKPFDADALGAFLAGVLAGAGQEVPA